MISRNFVNATKVKWKSERIGVKISVKEPVAALAVHSLVNNITNLQTTLIFYFLHLGLDVGGLPHLLAGGEAGVDQELGHLRDGQHLYPEPSHHARLKNFFVEGKFFAFSGHPPAYLCAGARLA